MRKNKILFLIPLILLVTAIVVFSELDRKHSFPPKRVACFDAFMNNLSTNGVGDLYIATSDGSTASTTFKLSNISHFKCSAQNDGSHYDQFEMTATDTEGHSLYVHKDEGGRAASGGDGYYDFCFKKDNKIIIAEKVVGRNNAAPGTCTWTPGFPTNPASNFEYTK
jgi:hypothetical protein